MSNDTFSIGEVALFYSPGSPAHGMEVIVVSALVWMTYYPRNYEASGRWAWIYQIDMSATFGKSKREDGLWAAEPHELRKKRPPADPPEQLGEWELCPWQPPTKVTA